MMGNSMIVSGESDENPRSGAVEMAPGTDLIVGCIIDTHFSQRGRHGRLLTSVAHFPQDLGFGIDENTAMIIEKGKFTVMGEGAVTVIDGGGMTYTDVPYVKSGQSITLADVKIHVLSEGYKFDFKTRQIVIPARKQTKAKSAGANENGKTKGKKTNGKGSKK
jgi:cyanophycinase